MNSSVDHKPYTTLSYADGPGYATAFSNDGERPDLTNIDTSKYFVVLFIVFTYGTFQDIKTKFPN